MEERRKLKNNEERYKHKELQKENKAENSFGKGKLD